MPAVSGDDQALAGSTSDTSLQPTDASTEPTVSSMQSTGSRSRAHDLTTPRAALVSPDRPFSQQQLSRIDEALTLASHETGLLFSVYVGELGNSSRDTAEAMFGRLAARHPAPVLLAISPAERRLEIVTGGESARRIPNRVAGLAALTMRASFSNGDLVGGIVGGLRQLADAAGAA